MEHDLTIRAACRDLLGGATNGGIVAMRDRLPQ